MQYRRRRDGLDPDRMRDVRAVLDNLLTEVAAGSELLHDGLPASSLDGQPSAIAIEAHLARPAIPAAAELLSVVCAPPQVSAWSARGQAAVVQAGRWWCGFWRMMLGGLPEGCRRPLSSSCRWRRCDHCRHQGQRLAVPWQAALAAEDCKCGGGGPWPCCGLAWRCALVSAHA